jgi:hypothetical protein
MDWRTVSHPTLGVPLLPGPEQLVLAYCASLNAFAIGYCRGGSWQVQPTPGGAISHWVALTPPAAAAASVQTSRYAVPAHPKRAK